MAFRKRPVVCLPTRVESCQPAGGWEAREAGRITSLLSPLCPQPIQSVSFLRGGYVEVPPKSLSPESSLLATFATKNGSGIILAALGKDSERAGGSQAHAVSSCDLWTEMPSRIVRG